jgi:release factor glutamine methyltransferase
MASSRRASTPMRRRACPGRRERSMSATPMEREDPRSVRARLRVAQEQLTASRVASPRHDAEALLAHVLDIERSGVARLLVLEARLDDTQCARFADLVAQRARRIPLQHLTGIAPFRRIDLRVGPGVFVPRPETELVAGEVIDALASREVGTSSIVVDLCSGSGAIALSIADEVSTAHVTAVELDPDALIWLERNVEALRVRDRVRVVAGDAGAVADLLPDLVGRCDVVVTNPPYVPEGASIRDPEVVDFDPALALWGGPDGLDVVRRIERQAARLLVAGGLFVVEHADLQGTSLPALLVSAVDHDGSATWVDVVDHVDLADRPRFTTARRAVAS